MTSINDGGPKGKPNNDEAIRRRRLGDLQGLFRDRYGNRLPDDDAGREDLWELLLVASLAYNPERMMRNQIAIWAPWMGRAEAAQLRDDVNRTPIYLRKPSARILGERLNLTSEERRRLGIVTIRPADMTDEQFEMRRKERRAYLTWKRRRDAGTKTRAEYLDSFSGSLNKRKPWEKQGISRRTWFRRRAKVSGTTRDTGSVARRRTQCRGPAA
jgi:hypothetical protein